MLELAAELEKKSWKGLEAVNRIVLAGLLVVLFGLGIQNYRECYDSYEQQKVETEKTLDLIGTPDEDVNMVTNGVKHLGWTVLYYYYPDNEIGTEITTRRIPTGSGILHRMNLAQMSSPDCTGWISSDRLWTDATVAVSFLFILY